MIMDKQPLISVIVPVYNVEQYLSKCVESILGQTYTNLEIILVDDGSPDNCGKMCDEYAAKDKRVKVIHKENGGLVSARNAGYDIMSGDWHMYVDSDDWIDANMCEKLVKALVKCPDVDMLYCKYVQELGNKTIKGKGEWHCQESFKIYKGDECKELARNTLNYKAGIATPICKLIRTDYAKKHGIKHDDRLRQGSEGLEFSLRAFYYAQKVMFINMYSYHYLYNPNSITKKIDEKNTLYLTDCYNLIAENIRGFSNTEKFHEALLQRVVYVLIAIAMNTYFHPANKDGLLLRIRKYRNVIETTPLYKEAVKKAKVTGMDKLRKITFLFIRLKMYFMLQPIAWLKQHLLNNQVLTNLYK